MERIEELTYRAQQRQRQGRTLEAIRLFEQALEYRISLHGPDSSSVKKACDNLSDILNGAALKHLQMEEYEEAKKLLQKAEMLTGPDDLISAVTYNNIACYYRRKNKLRTALKYLEKAQRIEMKSRVVANPAGTRLNLCAVLSQLERLFTFKAHFSLLAYFFCNTNSIEHCNLTLNLHQTQRSSGTCTSSGGAAARGAFSDGP